VGADTILPTEELLAAIPLELDAPFGRADFFASADTIRARLLQQGHAYAEVLRNFALDTVADVAEAEFVTIPGPMVYIDTIVFEGNERLTEPTLRRHLTIQEGQVLRDVELARTQRNLYNLDMVNFAAVRLAPDTLQQEQELEQATVLVQMVEAAQYAVEASAGFGTVDCLRTSAQWINRNFLDGGRRLELAGSVSRIGVGSPVDLGLERSVCSALGEEAFLGLETLDVRDRIDYTVRANLQQPSIFGTENRLAVDLHADRISEPDAYIRESVGGSVSAVRQFELGQTVVTTAVEVNRGRTIASPAILCVGFDTCTQDDFDLLTQARWSNSLALGAVRDRTRSDGEGSRGYLARGSIDWASAAFGSDDNYLRLLLEGSTYRTLRPGWVLAGNLRGGRFIRGLLGPDVGYIPPEQRFYAGGPNSVRGFTRNALGPTSYVVPLVDGTFSEDTIRSATGGTQMLVSSIELRMPSPFMSELTRLAVFLDAGHVTAPGSGLRSPGGIRFTPGAGVRFLTPVGPFRLDLAYNPYPPEIGPLYLIDPAAGLILIDSAYRPEPGGFLSRLRVQFALGQAF
jgi:outer membrane protein assembly factor BamA